MYANMCIISYIHELHTLGKKGAERGKDGRATDHSGGGTVFHG